MRPKECKTVLQEGRAVPGEEPKNEMHPRPRRVSRLPSLHPHCFQILAEFCYPGAYSVQNSMVLGWRKKMLNQGDQTYRLQEITKK